MSCLIYFIFTLLQFSLTTINAQDASTSELNKEQCELCRKLVDKILVGIRGGWNDTELATEAIRICVEHKLQSENVCEGLVWKNLGTAAFILRNRPKITAKFICSVLFQGLSCPRDEWDNPVIDISIDDNRPELEASKNNIPSFEDDDKLTVVQLTDSHYDPNYEVGANAVCDAPTCCRKNQGSPKNPLDGAGKWGDYRNCDSPWKAFINVLDQIRKEHENIDYIYFTGDTMDHGAWETSLYDNQESMKRTFDAIRMYFPDIPLIPIIGNHESYPVNQFSPLNISDTDINSEKFYDFVADNWDWLPLDARESIRNGGYYTMLLREGLRIIAMNNNDCYTSNLWLLYEPLFPGKQMQWLHDTLLSAEENNEKVHILAHIPNRDSEYYDLWSPYYRKIVDRFWNTISGQFNGHTHLDEFNLFYCPENPDLAVNVAFNGGSTTPFSNLNPNYKVYDIEPSTYQVVDQQAWIYNLTHANEDSCPFPLWYKEYDFKDDYGLTDLSPGSLDTLLDTFSTDSDKAQQYWRHKVKMADPSLEAGCSDECLLGHVCRVIDSDCDTRSNQILNSHYRMPRLRYKAKASRKRNYLFFYEPIFENDDDSIFENDNDPIFENDNDPIFENDNDPIFENDNDPIFEIDDSTFESHHDF